jgi:hypothetical protein
VVYSNFEQPNTTACIRSGRKSIVFHALSWFVVFSFLALWSLAAWAAENAGVLAGSSGAIEALRTPEWLEQWVPPELAVAFNSTVSITPAIEAVFSQAPNLAGGLSAPVWVVWGIGSALLIVLGSVLSGLCGVGTAVAAIS